MKRETAIALTRFGLGIRSNEPILYAEQNPRQWLHKQVKRNFSDPFLQRQFASTQDIARGASMADRKNRIKIYRDYVARRFENQTNGNFGFYERLVMFWVNHFSISIEAKNVLVAFAGAYEQEAIRPNILGKFENLLLSATQHPAMLVYLDNRLSVGPNSRVGLRKERGLNENHAREILELHTLGVNGGYSQQDVTNFAKVLTGWTTPRKEADYSFQRAMHEPGPQTIMGKKYIQPGEAQGKAVLKDLARHPATARHIATKLARHFQADDPSPSLIAKLENAYLKTKGDLTALYRTLIEAPEMWYAEQKKLKTPSEMVISAYKALLPGAPRGENMINSVNLLAQKPFAPPSPAGWPDRAQDWAGANAIKQRLEWANNISRKSLQTRAPIQIAQQVLGPLLSKETEFFINGAESTEQGLTLLLMSPEFQRR